MIRYTLRRLIQLIPTLFGISLVVFFLVRLTGDPAAIMLPEDTPPAVRAEFRRQYGLDDPLAVQYVHFVASALRGDFGDSLRYSEPALSLFVERLPATLELGGTALAIAVIIGVPIGILAAVRRNSRWDNAVRVLSLIGQAIPVFFLGLLLIIVFGAMLHLLPATGRGSWRNLILPSVSLATHLVALIARLTRYCILEVLSQDFIRTARAKGLTETTVLWRHALKNALIPVITIIGLQVGAIFSGAVVTESVFGWPGVGRLAVQSIYTRDFPVVQVVVLMTALIFVLVNLAIDLLYTYLDPRIRYS